MYAFESIATDL